MQGLLSVQVLRQLFSEAKVPLPFESDYWYTGSGFFLTSLGLAYFAKEKSDALQHIGLPDPAVLEQKQEKAPAADDVPVLQEQSRPAESAGDVPAAPEQK